MGKKILLHLCLALLAFSGVRAGEAETVWKEPFQTESSVKRLGGKLIRGGGPDGRNCVELTDKGGAVMIDFNRFRGRLVTIEAMVRGENLKGGTLQVYPAYVQGPGEFYPARGEDKGSFGWKKFTASVAIPSCAGKLQLLFNHALKGGTVRYADVRIVAVPQIAAAYRPDPAFVPQKMPKFRGAMVSGKSIAEPGAVREFAEGWGGNLIRYQFVGGGPKETPEQYFEWGRRHMAALDALLPELEKYGVKVVIDLHSGPNPVNELLQNVGVWSLPAQEMIIGLWKEIAAHYRGNPNIYGYDLLNEPHEAAYAYEPGGALDWNRFAERLAREVRGVDPGTPLIISSAVGGNAVGFAAMRPINVDNVIYTVHFYLPFGYTHQGVYSSPLLDAPYPGVRCDGRVWNKELLRKALEPVAAFQKKHRVPILVGEFGVVRWAPGAGQYLNDCIELFEEYGWDWIYHAYREWPGWNSELSADRENPKPDPENVRLGVLRRYLKRNSVPAPEGTGGR